MGRRVVVVTNPFRTFGCKHLPGWCVTKTDTRPPASARKTVPLHFPHQKIYSSNDLFHFPKPLPPYIYTDLNYNGSKSKRFINTREHFGRYCKTTNIILSARCIRIYWLYISLCALAKRKENFSTGYNEGITFVAFANLCQLVLVQIGEQVVALVHSCNCCFYENHRQIPFQP